jgi:hypothetical protein
MFCAPRLDFAGIEGVRSRFHVLRSRTRFRRYRGRLMPFSYFLLPDMFFGVPRVPCLFSCSALPDSLSVVPRASGPVFMFCTLGFVFGGTEGFGSRFHALQSRTHFRRYRRRPIPLSCFPLPDIFGGTKGVGSLFNIFAPRLIFGGTKGVRSRFHVFRSRTHFRRYRGRRVPFSSCALPDSFSTVPRASGPVFMFCSPRLVFGSTECVRSRFHVFRSRTCF